jgi:hypothetical protein
LTTQARFSCEKSSSRPIDGRRDVDDGGVEDDDELRRREQHEGQPAAV